MKNRKSMFFLSFFMVFFIALMYHPSISLADDYSEKLKEDGDHSTLIKMVDSNLPQAIDSVNKVQLKEPVNTNCLAKDDVQGSIIKNIINEYNKNVFMSFLGKFVPVDERVCANASLAEELNARNKYYIDNYLGAEKYTAYDLSVAYRQLEIKKDMAKVIIDRNIIFQTTFEDSQPVDISIYQVEGYILKKVHDGWKIANVLFPTVSGANDYLDELAASSDASTWMKLSTVKRCDYDARNFVDYLDADGNANVNKFLHPDSEELPSQRTPENNTQSPTKDVAKKAKIHPLSQLLPVYAYHLEVGYPTTIGLLVLSHTAMTP